MENPLTHSLSYKLKPVGRLQTTCPQYALIFIFTFLSMTVALAIGTLTGIYNHNIFQPVYLINDPLPLPTSYLLKNLDKGTKHERQEKRKRERNISYHRIM